MKVQIHPVFLLGADEKQETFNQNPWTDGPGFRPIEECRAQENAPLELRQRSPERPL
jgi:hypothetical protein